MTSASGIRGGGSRGKNRRHFGGARRRDFNIKVFCVTWWEGYKHVRMGGDQNMRIIRTS